MQKQLDEIFQKRMDRKDFLKHVGMGVAIITGTAGLVKLFQPQSQKVAEQKKHQMLGYGAAAYGGSAAQKS